MAREKAAAGRAAAPGPEPVLGADTAVVLGERVLGKPDNDDQALAMLRDLQDREHRVLSAVCVMAGDTPRLALSETRVRLRALDDERLLAATTDGVGLPLEETVPLLEWAGVPYWQPC